jgi:hypothetical protein
MLQLNYYQSAYITRNRDKSVAMLRDKHGMSDFILFDPDIEVKTPGGTGRAQTRVALGWAGHHQIEIIEPVSGLVDLYMPCLPKDDTSLGFHHTAVRCDAWQEFKEVVARERYSIAYHSGLEGLEFIYIDARATVGHYVEYMWATPEWWTQLKWPAGLVPPLSGTKQQLAASS